MTKDHICAGLHSETDYCAICLDPIPDGKPVPTEEEMQSFLSRCQEPFARLHSAMVYKAARRAYKGDWDDRLSIPEVYDSIIEELTEMKAELEKGSSPRMVTMEAGDIANFLAVLCDLYEKDPRPIKL